MTAFNSKNSEAGMSLVSVIMGLAIMSLAITAGSSVFTMKSIAQKVSKKKGDAEDLRSYLRSTLDCNATLASANCSGSSSVVTGKRCDGTNILSASEPYNQVGKYPIRVKCGSSIGDNRLLVEYLSKNSAGQSVWRDVNNNIPFECAGIVPPPPPPPVPSDIEVASTPLATCIRYNGAVACWGSNDNAGFGEPASARAESSLCPRQPVPALSSGVIRLVGVSKGFCALKTDNKWHCWGDYVYSHIQVNKSPEAIAVGGLPSDSPNLSPITVNWDEGRRMGTRVFNGFCVVRDNKFLCDGEMRVQNNSEDSRTQMRNYEPVILPTGSVIQQRLGNCFLASGSVYCFSTELQSPHMASRADVVRGMNRGNVKKIGWTPTRGSYALIDDGVAAWDSNGLGNYDTGFEAGSGVTDVVGNFDDQLCIQQNGDIKCRQGMHGNYLTYVRASENATLISKDWNYAASATCAKYPSGQIKCWGPNISGMINGEQEVSPYMTSQPLLVGCSAFWSSIPTGGGGGTPSAPTCKANQL